MKNGINNPIWKKDKIRSPHESKGEFQTPIAVCEYMASLIPQGVVTILEPTAGSGNLLSVLNGYQVTAPDDFFLINPRNFDCIIMNPPFSESTAILDNAPPEIKTGMKIGYHIFQECMKMSDHIIALMPWFTISDSDIRRREIMNFGLKSVTCLPRKTFRYARIQTVILEMIRGHKGITELKQFEF